MWAFMDHIDRSSRGTRPDLPVLPQTSSFRRRMKKSSLAVEKRVGGIQRTIGKWDADGEWASSSSMECIHTHKMVESLSSSSLVNQKACRLSYRIYFPSL